MGQGEAIRSREPALKEPRDTMLSKKSVEPAARGRLVSLGRRFSGENA